MDAQDSLKGRPIIADPMLGGGGVTGIESRQGCAAEEFDDPPFYTGVLMSK